MKRLFLLTLVALVSLGMMAQTKNGDTFTATNGEGVDVLYQIIDIDAKTVRVGKEAVYASDPPYTVSIDTGFTGPLHIPATVVHNGVTYRVVELGVGAFFWRGITELFLPEGLERINHPFGWNSSLRRFNIPTTVTSFAAQFGVCTAMESFEVPEYVTEVEAGMFAGSAFKSITLPAAITYVGNEAFCYDHTLQGLFLNATTPPTVHEMAFKQSTDFERTYLFVPEASLDAYRQADCWKDFQHISAPYAEGTVFKWADNTGLEFEFIVTSAKDKTVQLGTGNAPAISTDHTGNVNIPTFARGYRVASIAANAFSACTGITAVTATFDYPMAIPVSAFPASVYSSGYLYVPDDVRSRYETLAGWSNFANVNPELYKKGEYFTAKTVEGIDMSFYVSDDKKKLVFVERSEYSDEEHTIVHNVINKNTEGPVTIPDYVLGYKVVRISNFAFQECKKITSVHIPDAVTSIGQDAFLSCTSLEHANLPASLTTMADGVFYWCTKLKGPLSIPDGVTRLEWQTFAYCYSLEGIALPATLTYIDPEAFIGCSGMNTLTVGAGNSTYDSRNGCNALVHTATNTIMLGTANTTFPESITAIGDKAFSGVKALTAIDIPAWITSIGVGAYNGCKNIKSVTLHGATAIGREAFKGCEAIETVTSMAAEAYDIDDEAFDTNTYKNATLYVNDGLYDAFAKKEGWQHFEHHGNDGDDPDDPDDPSVVIADGAVFTAKTKEGVDVTYTVISAEAKTLMVGTADGTRAISIRTTGAVTIPAKVKGCQVVSIGAKAFWLCTDLTSIVIPEGVTTIGEKAFDYTNVTSFTIPSTVTTIGKSAFELCDQLTSINIPGSVTAIGDRAFYLCKQLTLVEVHSELPLSITNSAFSNRTNATLRVPAGCKSLYETAPNWKDFKEIVETTTPPTPVEALLYTTAEGFQLLIKITDREKRLAQVGDGTTAAMSASSEGSLFIPAQVFYYNITAIADNAFKGCSAIKEVYIPDGITQIGSSAFSGCSSLVKVYCLSQVAYSIPVKAFDSMTYLWAKLYVNAGLESDFSQVEGWKRFVNRGDPPIDLTGVTSFTAQTIEGVEVTYTVLDAEARTVMVGAENNGLAIEKFTKKSVTIPPMVLGCTVVAIGAHAFEWCQFVPSIILPNTLQTIGEKAFYGCTTIPSFDIPASVTTIGDYAFDYCIGMTYISIPASVTSLPNWTFSSCSALTMVDVASAKPFAISEWVFRYVAADATLYVPAGSRKAYQEAKYWQDFPHIVEGTVLPQTTETFTYETEEGVELTFKIIDHEKRLAQVGVGGQSALSTATTGTVTIPRFAEVYEVTAIATDAFKDCTQMTGVVIPASVASIQDGAFSNCNALETVTCWSATAYDIPANTFSATTYSSAELRVVEEYKADFAAAAGWKLFKHVGDAGIDLTSVKTFTAKTVEGVEVTYTVLDVDDRTVMVGTDSSSPDINSNTTGPVTIPETVRACTVVEVARYAFYDCTQVTTIVLPATVTKLGRSCFAFDYQLTSVNLPEGITTIPTDAFRSSYVSDIDIPASVTTIEATAFRNCQNLQTLTVHTATPPSAAADAFTNSYGATLVVPFGCKAAYQDAEVWRDFANIVEQASGVQGDANNDGMVSVADAVTVVNYLVDPTSTSLNAEQADINGDGEVNLADIAAAANIILNNNE